MITQLEERVNIVEDEINNLEGVDKKVMELQDKINRLGKHLTDVKVWHQDHAQTEAKLVVSENFYSENEEFVVKMFKLYRPIIP